MTYFGIFDNGGMNFTAKYYGFSNSHLDLTDEEIKQVDAELTHLGKLVMNEFKQRENKNEI